MSYDRRQPVVLDTGPLFTYLGWLYFDSVDADIAIRNAVLKDSRSGSIWDQNKHDRLDQFLKNAPRLLTTNHVAVEILNFREHSYFGKHPEAFRTLAIDYFNSLEELPVFIRDLDKDLLLRFGPTDAGLVWLAQREGSTLLTGERELYSALPSDPRFNIRLLEHVIESS